MQELYLQLQNLKRTDKYSLLLIAAVAVCLAIKFLAIGNKIISYRPAAKQGAAYAKFISRRTAAACKLSQLCGRIP